VATQKTEEPERQPSFADGSIAEAAKNLVQNNVRYFDDIEATSGGPARGRISPTNECWNKHISRDRR
jgi:hypothetical protein